MTHRTVRAAGSDNCNFEVLGSKEETYKVLDSVLAPVDLTLSKVVIVDKKVNEHLVRCSVEKSRLGLKSIKKMEMKKYVKQLFSPTTVQ